MNHQRNCLGFAVALLVLGVAVGAARAEVNVGDEAPDFSLQGSDGKEYKLSDFEGKQIVVIAWFPKAFTGGCTKECQSMRDNGKKIREFDVAYFAASVDKPALNKEFAESLDLDYPILSDPTKITATKYGVVNEKRPVAQRWTYYIGPDRKILYIDKEVKTENHGADIAAKLKELGAELKTD